LLIFRVSFLSRYGGGYAAYYESTPATSRG